MNSGNMEGVSSIPPPPPPPCVLCAKDLTVVKREVNFDEDLEGFSVPLEGEITGRVWSKDEKAAYQWFLKWFGLEAILMPKSKKLRISLTNLGWDGDSGEDLFPFCGDCGGKLGELVGIQRKMEELQRRITEGVEGLKEMAAKSEKWFEGMEEIYGRDPRYKRARSRFVPGFRLKYPEEKRKYKMVTETERKSVRRSLGGKDASTLNQSSTPLVVLTPLDMVNLEQHLLQNSNGNAEATAVKAPTVHQNSTPIQTAKRSRGRPRNTAVTSVESDLTPLDNKNVGQDLLQDAIDIKPPGIVEETTPLQTAKRPRGRPKKSAVSNVESEVTEFPPSPPDDFEDANDMDNNDSDYNPEESIPPTRPSRKAKRKAASKRYTFDDDDNDSRSPPPKPRRIPTIDGTRIIPKPSDADWQGDDLSPEDEETDASIDSDYDVDLQTGKRRKRPPPELDPSTGTITYKTLLFTPEGPSKLHCSKCSSLIANSKHSIHSHYVRKHTNALVCPQCSHRASNKPRLRDHIATIHEGAPPKPSKISGRLIPCRYCTRPLKPYRIKIHEWSHKNAQEKQDAIREGSDDVPSKVLEIHQCDACGQKLSSRLSLKHHQKFVHGPAPDAKTEDLCPECGGTFLNLKVHMDRVHGGNDTSKRPYTCLEPNCGKGFKNLRGLTKHKDAVHRKIRPHPCTLCPRTFANPRRLKSHMDLHNGVRPWQCPECPSAFISQIHLKGHMGRYHTPGKAPPKRKAYLRGPTMLGADTRKSELVQTGKYLPPSALASWAQGREPTSHFPTGLNPNNEHVGA